MSTSLNDLNKARRWRQMIRLYVFNFTIRGPIRVHIALEQFPCILIFLTLSFIGFGYRTGYNSCELARTY